MSVLNDKFRIYSFTTDQRISLKGIVSKLIEKF